MTSPGTSGNSLIPLFKFVKNPPPSPCRKYVQEFIDFAAVANRAPIGFYQAYPDLTVQDIKALIADSGDEAVRESLVIDPASDVSVPKK